MEDSLNFMELYDKMAHQVTETQDEFIFETLSNWLQNTSYHIKISKKELIEAITFYRKVKSKSLDYVHVNCAVPKNTFDRLNEVGHLEDYVVSQFYSELEPYIKKHMESRHDDILDATIYSLDLYMKHKEEWTNDRAETTNKTN